MFIIKVSYNQNWDCRGYHTTQNIKLPKELLNQFNRYLERIRNIDKNNIIIPTERMNFLAYGRNVENLNECLNLTQLRLLRWFLIQKHIDCSRIKTDRNTMLVIF